MDLGALLVVAVLLAIAFTLLYFKKPPDAVFLGGLALLLVLPKFKAGSFELGILEPKVAFQGFANPGLITIGMLFVVAAGVKETGAIDGMVSALLGGSRTLRATLVRLLGPVAITSSVVSNTPVVALALAPVSNWCKRQGFSASQFLMPLSFAAILGGLCTPFGTSTNLLVSGLLAEQGLAELGFRELLQVGLPTCLGGLFVLVLVAPLTLPQRQTSRAQFSDTRQYTIEMVVPEESSFAGKTVSEAGLRSLEGVYLTHIIKADGASYSVTPEMTLQRADRLVFSGSVDAIKELHDTKDLETANEQVFKLEGQRYNRRVFEAVISSKSTLLQKEVRGTGFRTRFGAVILAISRDGERLEGRIGDIKLRAGDTLLLEARPSFSDEYEHSRDFALIRPLKDPTPRRPQKAGLALGLLSMMVILASTGILPLVSSATLTAALMIGLRCCSMTQARQSVDWSVLMVIGAALGVAQAIIETGLANRLAQLTLALSADNTLLLLACLYFSTLILTELLTNNAAVALAFPIAAEVARLHQIELLPLALTITVAASASFLTPFGYQTNLMIYGPGGYKISDYFRLGLPVTLAVAFCCLSTIYFTL